MIYPKLQDKIDLIRMIINVYRQIQQEAFGIVLINKQNKVKKKNFFFYKNIFILFHRYF